MDAPKRRIESLDILRGAAIVGVITVHIVFGAGRSPGGMSDSISIAEFLYAALAMFMVISGYLYKKGKDFRTNLMTRVLPILIVLAFSTILFTTLMYGYLYMIGYDLGGYNLLEEIGEILIGKCVFQNIHDVGYNAGAVLSPFDISAGFYYLMHTTSSSITTWSRPTVCPGNFALFPHTMAYLKLERNCLWMSSQTSPMVLPRLTMRGTSISAS